MKMLDDMRTIKQLLTDAERIAREMGEEEPAAEHLLLAAVGLPDGTAARALASLGLDADAIRKALRDEQADALVAAGVARETAEAMAEPTPLGASGAPLLYGAGPSAREVFQDAGRLARSSKQRLAGAHVVAAVARLERGTLPRVLDRLGADRTRLADAARAELAVR
ncbi:MAG TPA: Clp protease N-terminal domain-containing protein [Candidatus Limnocylindria bacterium]|nr:Clp protease N-terminal domain-containing protein [Candidatus Limnocylindria bacterium]